MDLFSRKVVGWSMSQNIDRHLVLNALDMALKGRQPLRGLLHHSDRDSQYASAIPAAALYFGLGAEQAARLPGHFGALFVASSDVGGLLPAQDAVLERPSPEMLARARRWLGGHNTRLRPEALFSFIPRALQAAHARNEGLLVLTTRG